jgi:hypothetical protein
VLCLAGCGRGTSANPLGAHLNEYSLEHLLHTGTHEYEHSLSMMCSFYELQLHGLIIINFDGKAALQLLQDTSTASSKCP